jgi:membrane protein required for colicin V production
MPVSYLDLFVIGVVFLSALLAALRGFTREILAIGSWVVAAVVAYIFYPQAVPLVQQYLPVANKTVILAVAAGSIFFLTLIVAYFVTAKLSDVILDSSIGPLDRTLGFLFGAARGLLIAVICFMLVSVFLQKPEVQPSWMREAKLRPLLESSSEVIRGWLPENPDQLIQQRLQGRQPDAEPPAEVVPAAPVPERRTEQPRPAPSGTDRQNLQRIIETSGQPPRPAPAPAPQPR